MIGSWSCGEGGRGVAPALGPAIALDEASPVPSAEDLAELRRLGVSQHWLEWATLHDDDAAELSLRRSETPPLPRGQEVVLVVRGAWDALRRAEDGAVSLARQLVAAAAEAEAAGALVPAVVLALEASEPRPEDAALLARVRDGLGGRRSLGVDIARSWLVAGGSEDLREVVARADFTSSHLYGGDATTDAWDFGALRAGAGLLEALDRPYLVGVSILGSLERAQRGEGVVRALPVDVLYARRLLVQPQFAFEGYARQLLELRFLARTELDGVTALPGEVWNLSRPTSGHLAQVLEALRSNGSARYLGAVLRPLRPPNEALAVPLPELLRVLAGEPTSQPLELAFEVRRSGGEWATELVIANLGAATAAAVAEHNLVEVSLADAAFESIDPGGFQRFELLDDAGRRTSMRAARTLRLYFRFLERGERLASGPIRWRGDSGARAAVSARHLTVTGEVMEATAAWPADL